MPDTKPLTNAADQPAGGVRILNAEPSGYSEMARRILRELGVLDEQELDRAELLRLVPEYDVLIVRLAQTIDREVLDTAERLSVIVSATTGLDHIDIEHAALCGVTVLSLRGEHAFLRSVSSTAEHTWGLLLALVRRIPAAFADVLDGDWDRDRHRGVELQGKRLGVLGMGRIGTIVSRYGLAFGMEVQAFDPAPVEWPADVGRAQSLDELASTVDVLSIHVPLDDSTVGLVDEGTIAELPSGSILLNTARASIVDSDALLAALQSGHLAGAAIDVLDFERDDQSRRAHPLIAYARQAENLIITPHIGGATHQAMERTEVFMAEKLRDHLKARR